MGVTIADFTYVPGQYGRVISQHRDSDSSFYHFDGTENVRKLTDDMEAVTDEYAFDAFGNELSSSGSTANSQRYKGRLLAYHQDPEAAPAAAVRVAPPPLRPVDRRLHQPRPGRGRQQPVPVREKQPAQSRIPVG